MSRIGERSSHPNRHYRDGNSNSLTHLNSPPTHLVCDEPNRNPLPESHQPGSAAHAIVASRSPAGLRKLTVCSGEHVRHVRVNSGVPSISPPGTHGLIADCIIPHHEVVYGRREFASLNDRSFLVANKVSAHHCARCVCDRLILGTGGAETGSPDDCFLRSVSLWDKDQLAFLSPTRTRTGRRIRAPRLRSRLNS